MPSVSLLVLALLAATLVFAVFLWRREVVLALPFLAILNGLSLPVGGSSVRIDQLVACVLVVPLCAGILTGARRLRMDATAWWLVALLGVNVLASMLNSPARSYSLLQCVNLASAWVIYLVLINLLETRDELATFLDRCLMATIVAAVIGIVAFLLAIAGLRVGGAEVSSNAAAFLTSAYGAYGTMVEPNLFGSFMGAYFVLAITLIAVAPRLSMGTVRVSLLRWTAALSAVGLVLSFTRSAWLGVIAIVLLLALLGRLRFGIRIGRMIAPVVVLVLIVAGVAVLPGDAGTLLRFKLVNLVNPATQTATMRIVTYSLALEQTLRHPVIGWGTFTFAPLVAEGADFAQFQGWRNLWIGNYLLLALHDTGVVGLFLWIGMLWTIVTRGLRAADMMSATDPEIAARSLALTLAVASLLVPFLATTGFSLGYPWLLIGLLGAHARHARAAVPAPAPVPARAEPVLGLPLDAT